MKHIFKYEVEDYVTGRITSTVEVTSYNGDLSSIIEDFRSYLLACGFHPDTIKDYFYDETTNREVWGED